MQVILERNEGDETPWGFRLQGGTEKGQPLTIYRIAPMSVAENQGLLTGDVLESLNGLSLTQKTLQEAQDCIKQAGSRLELIVTRNSDTSNSVGQASAEKTAQKTADTEVEERKDAPSALYERSASDQFIEACPVGHTVVPKVRQYGRHNSGPVYGTNGPDSLAQLHSHTLPSRGSRANRFAMRQSTPPQTDQSLASRSNEAATGGVVQRKLGGGKSYVKSPALERIRRQSELLQSALDSQSSEAREQQNHSGGDRMSDQSQRFLDFRNLIASLPAATVPQASSLYRPDQTVAYQVSSNFNSARLQHPPTPIAAYPTGVGALRFDRATFDELPKFASIPESPKLSRQSRRQFAGVSAPVSYAGEVGAAFDSESSGFSSMLPADSATGVFSSSQISDANYSHVVEQRFSKYKDEEDGYTSSESASSHSQQSVIFVGTHTPPKPPQALHSIMKVHSSQPGKDYTVNKSNGRSDGKRQHKRVAINPHVQILFDDCNPPINDDYMD